jgi:hypothetical protein
MRRRQVQPCVCAVKAHVGNRPYVIRVRISGSAARDRGRAWTCSPTALPAEISSEFDSYRFPFFFFDHFNSCTCLQFAPTSPWSGSRIKRLFHVICIAWPKSKSLTGENRPTFPFLRLLCLCRSSEIPRRAFALGQHAEVLVSAWMEAKKVDDGEPTRVFVPSWSSDSRCSFSSSSCLSSFSLISPSRCLSRRLSHMSEPRSKSHTQQHHPLPLAILTILTYLLAAFLAIAGFFLSLLVIYLPGAAAIDEYGRSVGDLQPRPSARSPLSPSSSSSFSLGEDTQESSNNTHELNGETSLPPPQVTLAENLCEEPDSLCSSASSSSFPKKNPFQRRSLPPASSPPCRRQASENKAKTKGSSAIAMTTTTSPRSPTRLRLFTSWAKRASFSSRDRRSSSPALPPVEEKIKEDKDKQRRRASTSYDGRGDDTTRRRWRDIFSPHSPSAADTRLSASLSASTSTSSASAWSSLSPHPPPASRPRFLSLRRRRNSKAGKDDDISRVQQEQDQKQQRPSTSSSTSSSSPSAKKLPPATASAAPVPQVVVVVAAVAPSTPPSTRSQRLLRSNTDPVHRHGGRPGLPDHSGNSGLSLLDFGPPQRRSVQLQFQSHSQSFSLSTSSSSSSPPPLALSSRPRPAPPLVTFAASSAPQPSIASIIA